MHNDRVYVYIRHHVFVVVVERERLAFRRRRLRAQSHRPRRFRPVRRAGDVTIRHRSSRRARRRHDAFPGIFKGQPPIGRFQKRHRSFEPSISKRRLLERVRVHAQEFHRHDASRVIFQRRRVRVLSRERVRKVSRAVPRRRRRVDRRARHLDVHAATRTASRPRRELHRDSRAVVVASTRARAHTRAETSRRDVPPSVPRFRVTTENEPLQRALRDASRVDVRGGAFEIIL